MNNNSKYMTLDNFNVTTKNWFEKNFKSPTEAQRLSWPSIQKGKHTLISAPTGSGKTLAAFYISIDKLIKQSINDQLSQETQILYVSPLKALSNDIHKNLQIPLEGIKKEMLLLGLSEPDIKISVRTGDTTQNERRQMIASPPHILVTTPESLYLLLTSVKGREMLSKVNTLIIDEIHALLGSKRGSHLSLSIERLESLVHYPIQRIGLSATQKPIERIAKYLVGNSNIIKNKPQCSLIEVKHKRKFDLTVEVPNSPLTAVMSNKVWSEIYDKIVKLINNHNTTLIFVNTRRLAERLALALSEKMEKEEVTSHHGSMSKEHRLKAEQNLKSGKLKVLIATASMELGIDIGSVDLVVQISSPKSISNFLQRVGRSRHYVGGIPNGVIFPLSRDDLVECIALIRSVQQGELDEIKMPEKPLDILAQQIIAELSSKEWNIDKLYMLIKNSYSYRNLCVQEYQDIIEMLPKGYTPRRGRKTAHIHYDAINSRIKARKGARLIAITNGGAIPDMFDYEVVMHPEGTIIGSVNEDFALESTPGDIFTLGTHSWQLLRVEGLKILVKDATGIPPTVPFWFGEGAGRTIELSESISKLKNQISKLLDEDPLQTDSENMFSKIKVNKAVRWLQEEIGIDNSAAEQAIIYLYNGMKGLGDIPSLDTIIIERFFDDAGDMHVVIHSQFGSRVNKAWGLSLRKKFCRKFNFELQAAANDDSIILSLSSSHSFPLEEVFNYLNKKTIRDTLIQAMLDAPMFDVRWRWNATIALAIQRNRAGKRVAPQLQRMQSEDLIAQVFPDQIACFENIDGQREIPDHPLVAQTINDCLTEAMDIDMLENILLNIEKNNIDLISRDLREPSPFAQEIINARPYAFLDDTEFFERRVNAVRTRSWLDPSEATELSNLDPESIKHVKNEAWPQAKSADELHYALSIYGYITSTEIINNEWGHILELLRFDSRAFCIITTNCKKVDNDDKRIWIATERFAQFRTIFPHIENTFEYNIPDFISNQNWSFEEALKEIIRGRLEALGPVCINRFIEETGITENNIKSALAALESEGFVFRGHFTNKKGNEEWCERRLLQRIHRYSIDSLRESIKPVSVQDFMRFLFFHHGVTENNEMQTGLSSLEKTLRQLEGYVSAAVSWERDIITTRIKDYDPEWLDILCTSGKFTWGRLEPPKTKGKGSPSPVKRTPISFMRRENLELWNLLSSVNISNFDYTSSTKLIMEYLDNNGASFFNEIIKNTSLLKSQVQQGLAELVAYGAVSCDNYSGLRALLTPGYNSNRSNSRRRKKSPVYGIENAGRWTLMHKNNTNTEIEYDYKDLEKLALIFIDRWGVVFRTILENESFAPPWRILVRVLRRLELKGVLRAGRFISNVSGEQFAYPETVVNLREIKNKIMTGQLVSISAADPLNLIGSILPGDKVPNLIKNRILYRDGIPIAVLEGIETKFLKEFSENQKWELKNALIRRAFPPKLKAYLGRNYK